MRVWSGETPGSPVARLPASGETPASSGATKPLEGGEQLAGLQRQRNPSKRRHANPPRGGPRESRARQVEAKATESTPDPGAGAQELSGVMGVERSEGCPGNWRGPPRPEAGGGDRRELADPTCGGDVPKRVTGGPCVARSSGRAEDHRPATAEREAKPAHNRQNRETVGRPRGSRRGS